MRNAIHAYSMKYQGDWSKIAQAIIDREPYECTDSLFQYVTIVDQHYPNQLKQLRFPPWILYYEGDFSLLQKKTLGIVGSRKLCPYAEDVIVRLCLANQEKVIVSGLAKGADTKAHQCALNTGTIGVLGCGLDVAYPKENRDLIQMMKKNHLVLSEYPEKTKPLKHHFPWRNRIIAALSDQIVAVQAQIKSGTSTTVMKAIELSKDVYCVPYPLDFVDGQGCNHLISQGAQILLSADEKI